MGPKQIKGVVSELSELVGDLGLDDAKPHHTAIPPDDAAELAALAAAVEGVEGAELPEAIPLWETADVAESATSTPADDVALWDAFAPELDPTPARPWTPEAAMAVVEPGAPDTAASSADTPRRRGWLRLSLPRLFTAATVAAVLVAVAVVVLTRLDFGHTAGPAQPSVRSPFEVTVMHTVDATSAASVPYAKTASHFPAKATQIFMDVVYRNAAPGDTLRIVINALPPAGSGGNPTKVGDQTHALPDSGEIAITILGPASGFEPGEYSVNAFHDGHLEQSLGFTVDASIAPQATPGG